MYLSNEHGFIKIIHISVLLILCFIEVAILIREFDKRNYINSLIETDKHILCDFWEEITYKRFKFSQPKKVVICHYTDEYGKKHIFRSDAFPTAEKVFTDGDYIKIYTDISSSDKRYFISSKMIKIQGIGGVMSGQK